MNDLSPLVQEARDDFEQASAPADLENAKARYLGKTGRVTEQLKALGALSPDDKKARGALINAAKQQIEAALKKRVAKVVRLNYLNADDAKEFVTPLLSKDGGEIKPGNLRERIRSKGLTIDLLPA